MSELQFDDGDQIVPKTRSAGARTAPKKNAREADEGKDERDGDEKKEPKRKQSEAKARMPLYIGLGVGAFVVLVLVIVVVALSLGGGGSRSGSYTDKALSAYTNGYAADFYRKGRTPTAKQVAEVEKKLKKVKAGTTADFRQGLRILNVHRDLDDYQLDTLGTSEYLRSTFFDIFGHPSDTPQKTQFPQMKTWHHRCSDGQVEMLGVLQIEGNPDYMKILPPKRQQSGK